MSLGEWQLQLESVSDASDHVAIAALASSADPNQAEAVFDAIVAALATTTPESRRRLHYWGLLDKLCKTHSNFIPAITRRFVATVVEYAPAKGSDTFPIFLFIIDSMRHFLGAVVAVAKAKINALATDDKPLTENDASDNSLPVAPSSSFPPAAAAGRNANALVLHRAALSTMGGFMARKDNSQRTGPVGTLQVRTRDSVGAMKAANAYAPAMAVEVAMAPVRSDADALSGYRQALPSNHIEEYRRARQKRLRETFEQTRRENEERDNKKALAELERQAGGGENEEAAGVAAAGSSTVGTKSNLVADVNGGRASLFDFTDIVMPTELPRDEYGVQIANFPLGVRFLREAIRACGGALELETIVQRLSTLSGIEKDKFGHVREFVSLHTPSTFLIQQEKDKFVVRVREPGADEHAPPTPSIKTADGQMYFSWERVVCPLCLNKTVKGRNLARHLNCRRCIKAQVAKGLMGEPTSPIGVLHMFVSEFMRKHTEAMMEGYALSSGAVFDDGDLEYFEDCIKNAAKVKRYQFSSTRTFAPVLKAIFVVRARWLAIHNVSEIKDIPVGPSDRAFVSFFGTLGSLIHRLPIAWIETGDIVDLCRRFCAKPLPAHNPPPRPADPRIQMTNEFPGFLFCDSEIDSEDEVSPEDDEACSDDEQEQFVLAPPVSVVESLMTVGFERDTRRLEYRLRTRPPMVLRKALKLGGNATQAEVYQAAEV